MDNASDYGSEDNAICKGVLIVMVKKEMRCEATLTL
jgi:hypothetical protein